MEKVGNTDPREREVTALICLGYTTSQAAVKFHVRNAVQKFGVENRSQLQQLLREWDFSAWQDTNQGF